MGWSHEATLRLAPSLEQTRIFGVDNSFEMAQ
jgi:hypothetical protein